MSEIKRFREEVAARRVVTFSHDNKELACPNHAEPPIDSVEKTSLGSNRSEPQAKENPGSAATETGMDLQDWLSWVDNSLNRETAARGLLDAVLACDPRDRIPLMERFIDALRHGAPLPPFGGVMDEASFWADGATTAELKCYAVACYSRLSPKDQRGFLGYVQGMAAA